MSSPSIVHVSVTCTHQREARRIADALLRKKLVACANSWPVQSHYWWNGKRVNRREVLVVFKTLAKQAKHVEREIIRQHSYRVACITIGKVSTNAACAAWAKQVITTKI